ncbi:ribosome biogenesis GTP-binding protein YsxC [Cordyceps javanica]|uniref:Ribosome biogenesis GTP-binding protein YsxC n=1 Tax=Cordyceps javanica TaxID=43265 RepID=A0A545V4M3_9HYPO|nr:ribosome biogenesis GTP-binding protein YsxC [Cordyceps javanica]TQW07936.1 ribosome biogenesis GTP-binding protein YsxC [Cordyceps javanica]
MSRRTALLVRRMPLAPPITNASTRRLLSQSQLAHTPRPTSASRPQNTTRISAHGGAPLDSPATYTSIVSHAASPSSLTTTAATGPGSKDQAKLARAGTFFETDARFLYSAAQFRDHPFNEQVPEVVILGASNVGKSTFLNALVGRRGVARTSPKPGHTTLMNAFGLGRPLPVPRTSLPRGAAAPRHGLVVVDTPGYGFRSQATWGDTVVRYLGARKALRGAVVLLSAEKRLMPEDRWLLEALADADVRTVAVVTKADKAARGGGGGGDWAARCAKKAEDIRRELRRTEKATGSGWREGAGWSSDVFVTAAGLGQMGKTSNRAGMGGVRAAILDMAGFTLEDDAVEQQPENISYTGKIVSFDDIVWKS